MPMRSDEEAARRDAQRAESMSGEGGPPARATRPARTPTLRLRRVDPARRDRFLKTAARLAPEDGPEE